MSVDHHRARSGIARKHIRESVAIHIGDRIGTLLTTSRRKDLKRGILRSRRILNEFFDHDALTLPFDAREKILLRARQAYRGQIAQRRHLEPSLRSEPRNWTVWTDLYICKPQSHGCGVVRCDTD